MTKKLLGPQLGIGAVFVAICVLIGADAFVPGFAAQVSSLREWQDLAGAGVALRRQLRPVADQPG